MTSRAALRLHLALVQMQVEPGATEKNTRHALESIHRAADQGADVILLPEALPIGWTHPSARQHAASIPDGPFCTALRGAAAQHKIHICSGLVERDPVHGRIYNSAILLDSEGEVLLHHRKVHELDIARDLYCQGDSLQVATTRWGKIGIMICADAFVEGQVLSRSLAVMGARLILSPCAWAVPADHDNEKDPYGKLWLDNYSPVARAHGTWIAGASNVGPITAGPWRNYRCIGNSLVVDSTGNPALWGPYGVEAEAILSQEITMMDDPGPGTQ